MIAIALLCVRLLCDCFKARSRLEAEIVVLRHQLAVLRRGAPRRLYLRWADRVLFVWLYRRFPRILDAITIVRPETVVRWHEWGSPLTGDGSPARSVADRGSISRFAT
jgi:hypothetical protein